MSCGQPEYFTQMVAHASFSATMAGFLPHVIAGTAARRAMATPPLAWPHRLMPLAPDPALVALFDKILSIVASELGLDLDQARSHSAYPARAASRCWVGCSDARRVTIYLLRVVGDHHNAAVARAVGMTAAATSIACGAVEDARESPEFEALIARLEEKVSAVLMENTDG